MHRLEISGDNKSYRVTINGQGIEGKLKWIILMTRNQSNGHLRGGDTLTIIKSTRYTTLPLLDCSDVNRDLEVVNDSRL